MSKTITKQSDNRDHDLLIRIEEKVEQLTREVKDLKDNVASRVSYLEDEKLDKEEAQRMKDDADKIHNDFETRMRSLEMWKWVLSGATIVISFVAPYIVNYFTK